MTYKISVSCYVPGLYNSLYEEWFESEDKREQPLFFNWLEKKHQIKIIYNEELCYMAFENQEHYMAYYLKYG